MTTLVLSAQERDELGLLLESALADLRLEISHSGRYQHDEMREQRRAILSSSSSRGHAPDRSHGEPN